MTGSRSFLLYDPHLTSSAAPCVRVHVSVCVCVCHGVCVHVDTCSAIGIITENTNIISNKYLLFDILFMKSLSFKLNLFILFYSYECLACMYVCVLDVCLVPTEVKRSPGTGVMDGCESRCGCGK